MTPDPQALSHAVKTAFPNPPDRLGVAVSGGSDSMALLVLLADTLPCALQVATVDHGLRSEAADEARAVAEFCAARDLPHRVLTWQGWDKTGNLQAEARAARYRLLSDWAAEEGINDVALGHTGDDNAETFVMGLARGAGLDGLSGMRRQFTRGPVTFHRPLLDVSRDDLRTFLSKRGISWADDPSNEDTAYQRVQTRATLAELAGLGIDAEVVGKVVANLSHSRAALERLTHAWARTHLRFEQGDICFPLSETRDLDPELRRRLFGHALRNVSGRDYPPRAEKLMGLVTEPAQNRTLHGCLITASPSSGVVRITREARAVASELCATDALWDGRWRFEGPHCPGLRLAAMDQRAVTTARDMAEDGAAATLPTASLLAMPAVFEGAKLVAAPLAGWPNGWCARLTRSGEQFLSGLLSH